MNKFNIIKSSIFILFVSNSANFINFIFNILISKYLLENSFSLFTSLNGFYLTFLTPFAGLIFIFQLKINILKNDQLKLNEYLKNIFFFFVIIIFCFLFLLLLFNSYLIKKFDTSFSILFSFFLLLAVGLMTVLPLSILNSYKKYIYPHLSNLFNDIIRLFILLLFIFFINSKYSFFGALLATLICIFGHFIITTYLSIKLIDLKKFKFSFDIKLKEILSYDLIRTFLFMLSLSVLLNMDVVLSRIYFDPIHSAEYNLASFFSKAIYFLPSVLFSFIFNEQVNKNKNSLYGIIFIIIINIIGMLILIFLFDYFIKFFYEGKFENSSRVIYYLGPCMVFLSTIVLYFNKLLASNNFDFIYYVLISAISFLFISYFNHESIESISQNLLISLIFLYLFPILKYVRK